MSTLLQEIEAQISGLKSGAAKQNVGTVREIGDGVAKVEGLSDAMLNEMLDFGNGIVGLALNLEETEVGAIILGDYTGIKEGQEVKTTGKLLQVPVGMGLLGRVVNALGQPLDDKGPIKADAYYPVEKIAPVHPKQVLTYLRLLNLEVGLLINFGAPTLKEGLQRVVNNLSPSASPRLRVCFGFQKKSVFSAASAHSAVGLRASALAFLFLHL